MLTLCSWMSRRAVSWHPGLASPSLAFLVLLRAKRLGEIHAVKPEIDLLRSKARFFVSSALVAKVLTFAAE
jgi:hypothetical protein